MIKELDSLYNACKINQEPNCPFPNTTIYNEGWLLRAFLEKMKDPVIGEKLKKSDPNKFRFLPFPKDTVLYSEGSIFSPFTKDKPTQADGIVGQFEIRIDTKSGIKIKPGFDYFNVFEAKINSPIKSGIAHIGDYSQITRIIACMINMISNLEKDLNIKNKKIFFVFVYPEEKEKKLKIDKYTDKNFISEQIKKRIIASPSIEESFKNYWETVLNQIELIPVTWEDLVSKIDDTEYSRFYESCKEANDPKIKEFKCSVCKQVKQEKFTDTRMDKIPDYTKKCITNGAALLMIKESKIYCNSCAKRKLEDLK